MKEQLELADLKELHSLTPELRESLDEQAVRDLKGRVLVIKYGGNAMLDAELQRGVMEDVSILRRVGASPVIVHGGGPFIQKLLDQVGMDSEFVGGHRKTTPEMMKYVEMALKGEVNGALVRELLRHDCPAVGLSGKDGGMVKAVKRKHTIEENGKQHEVDLGLVGDVGSVEPALLNDLLKDGFVPVVAPIAIGPDHMDHNINADMFAGHIAGALKASDLLMLTDVDGLRKDKDDPETLMQDLSVKETESLYGTTIQGGMIPKIDACRIALDKGVKNARIVNGTDRHSLLKEFLTRERSGTRIHGEA